MPLIECTYKDNKQIWVGQQGFLTMCHHHIPLIEQNKNDFDESVKNMISEYNHLGFLF